MNPVVAVAAVVLAADLPQRLSMLASWPRDRRLVVALGAIVGNGVLAFVAGPLIDALDVSPPTMQIGAAMVLGLWSIWMFFSWSPDPLAGRTAPPSLGDAVVPAAFPVVLSAPLSVVTVGVAARDGVAEPLVAAAVVAVLVAFAGHRAVSRLGTWPARRVTATFGVVVAFAVLLDGVYAV